MAEKKVTIYDVAKHCGVSVATVSRIVNNVDYPVSAELRTRVSPICWAGISNPTGPTRWG